MSLLLGVHEKLPFVSMSEEKSELLPLNESSSEYRGPENPTGERTSVSGVPTTATPEFERLVMLSEGVALTVICCCAEAVAPEESVTLSVRIWVPTSLAEGVHEKLPPESRSEVVTLLPLKESVTPKVGPLNPEDETTK